MSVFTNSTILNNLNLLGNNESNYINNKASYSYYSNGYISTNFKSSGIVFNNNIIDAIGYNGNVTSISSNTITIINNNLIVDNDFIQLSGFTNSILNGIYLVSSVTNNNITIDNTGFSFFKSEFSFNDTSGVVNKVQLTYLQTSPSGGITVNYGNNLDNVEDTNLSSETFSTIGKINQSITFNILSGNSGNLDTNVSFTNEFTNFRIVYSITGVNRNFDYKLFRSGTISTNYLEVTYNGTNISVEYYNDGTVSNTTVANNTVRTLILEIDDNTTKLIIINLSGTIDEITLQDIYTPVFIGTSNAILNVNASDSANVNFYTFSLINKPNTFITNSTLVTNLVSSEEISSSTLSVENGNINDQLTTNKTQSFLNVNGNEYVTRNYCDDNYLPLFRTLLTEKTFGLGNNVQEIFVNDDIRLRWDYLNTKLLITYLKINSNSYAFLTSLVVNNTTTYDIFVPTVNIEGDFIDTTITYSQGLGVKYTLNYNGNDYEINVRVLFELNKLFFKIIYYQQ